MLVAALPERFESAADHHGVLLGERSALGGSVGDLRLERDAGGDHRQRLKRGIRLNVRKGGWSLSLCEEIMASVIATVILSARGS